MTTAALNPRAVPFALLALLLLLSCFRPLAAQEVNQLLDAVHKFRLQNYMAINAFYNYSATRDPNLMTEIVESVNQANGLMQTISEGREGALEDQLYQNLAARFQEFKELMNTNVTDVKKNGYADLRIVSELASKTQELNDTASEAYRSVAENTGTTTVRSVELAREATLMLARMMSQYSAFSSSNVAQIFQGATDAGGPIDEQARNLDKVMKELEGIGAAGEAKDALSKAHSTWGFIRDSYINYNERNVSFVINRYSKTIIDSLVVAIPGLIKA